jgi:signal transduction histidine kinase
LDKDQQQHEKRNANLELVLQNTINELQQVKRALQIETALEKVSARTMAMRSSSELAETSAVLFQELKDLGINAIRTGVGIFDDANEAMEIWGSTVADSQEVARILDYVSLHIHPVFENIGPARKQKKPFALTVLSGNEVWQYYETMSAFLTMAPHQLHHEKEFFYSFLFTQGALNVTTSQQLTEEECNIIAKFAQVFELIYLRFLELLKAEAQTQEAIRQTAFNRVRAEIASMRTIDDLNIITPLIWKTLMTLGVPFSRCGVFIIDETEQVVHAYLSTPEGASLAVLELSYESSTTIQQMVENWRQQKVYTEQWDRQQFRDWMESLYKQGQIKDIQQYQHGESAIESLSLQFIPFSKGMLYVGSYEPVDVFQIDFLTPLADSFSVAYDRYEDFQKLEDAKSRIETTLAELKATQSQLIQSEKMASLGELTAGIAHEIQNPLNFVNNFSDLNTELIDELQLGLKAGHIHEAFSISNNIKSNEQKILHHGKRADAIVKGMLQHSRSGTGVKEPTDINALTDEYLRLRYHGFRANDSGFSAIMKTDFDETIGNIRILPQDIGRVLLNLYNNAFYAIHEKAKKQTNGYEPTISVTTKKTNNIVEIAVWDNGNGIPQKAIDKIFQPFFTTKPAGQGTGLGLSLCYDIIKAHGGEIKVDTREGEFTEFVIQIPQL